MPPSDSPGMTRTDQSDPPLMKKNPWELERKICGILGQIETEIPFESGIKIHCWDFPGGPVANIPCSHRRARGPSLIPGQGTRSHLPKLRVCMPQLKILYAATKTGHR